MNENNRPTEIKPIDSKKIPTLEQVLDSIREPLTKSDTENIENRETTKEPSETLGVKEIKKPVEAKTLRGPSLLREFGSLGIKIAVIIVIALILFNFVYGLHYNIEPGMNPSIKDGDLVMYYRWNKNYHADDLVLLTFQGKTEIRRVVATAGDAVNITEDGLIINDALQHELGIYQETPRYADGIEFPVTLGEGQVFVLGDARENATDSRIYGPVNVKDIHGIVITIFRRRNL